IKDDPLTGGAVPHPPAPAVAPAGPPRPAAAVPPLPVATSADSTASLAGGKPLVGGRELGITEPRDRLAKNSWKEPGPDKQGGTVLQNPEPVALDPVHRLTVFDGNNVPPSGGATREQLLAQLSAKGMKDYWEQKYGDGVKFTCTVPRKNSNRLRQLEAVAGTPVEAVQAVLQQMEQQP